MKTHTVANPLHLKAYLDYLFMPDCDHTVCCIYKTYWWLAYSGVDEEDTIKIKCRDVDLSDMVIRFNGREYPIYTEALQCIRDAATLDEFRFIHPVVGGDSTMINRVRGDELLRGRSDACIDTLRSVMSRTQKRKKCECPKGEFADMQLSYYRVKISGLFNEVYELERAGICKGFDEAVDRFVAGKEYKNESEIRHKTLVALNKDYIRWKMAYSN